MHVLKPNWKGWELKIAVLFIKR